jgi:hypothetical protein
MMMPHGIYAESLALVMLDLEEADISFYEE